MTQVQILLLCLSCLPCRHLRAEGVGPGWGRAWLGPFPLTSLRPMPSLGLARCLHLQNGCFLSSLSALRLRCPQSAGPLRAWERCPLGRAGWRRQAAGPKVLPRPSPGEGAVQGLKTHASWGSPCLPSRSIPLEKESSNPFKPQHLITPQTFSASSVAAAGT